MMETKLNDFARLVENDQIQNRYLHKLACEANLRNCKTTVKIGKKYAKVDVGDSGKFMVDMATLEIFGIKAYGVIHKQKKYGTLDTIHEFNWGDYTPRKL